MSDTPRPDQAPETRKDLPAGYRQGVITAITVLLGFSLAFLRYWSFEVEGKWNPLGVIVAGMITVGTVIQLFALKRALMISDDELPEYKRTVAFFVRGVIIVLVGVAFAALVSAL